jgi:hypothetical protein
VSWLSRKCGSLIRRLKEKTTVSRKQGSLRHCHFNYPWVFFTWPQYGRMHRVRSMKMFPMSKHQPAKLYGVKIKFCALYISPLDGGEYSLSHISCCTVCKESLPLTMLNVFNMNVHETVLYNRKCCFMPLNDDVRSHDTGNKYHYHTNSRKL